MRSPTGTSAGIMGGRRGSRRASIAGTATGLAPRGTKQSGSVAVPIGGGAESAAGGLGVSGADLAQLHEMASESPIAAIRRKYAREQERLETKYRRKKAREAREEREEIALRAAGDVAYAYEMEQYWNRLGPEEVCAKLLLDTDV